VRVRDVDAHVERQLAHIARRELIDERLMEVRIEPLAVHGRRHRGRQHLGFKNPVAVGVVDRFRG
jgi:hypothetical protein